ncbi:MAG: hydroxyacylglutathione hydrolase family protein [Nannocystaceae bacterium]
MLEIVQIEVGLGQNLCELLACPGSGEAAVIDPAFEGDRLLRIAAARGLRIATILVTHGHPDHIADVDVIAAATGAEVRCHPGEVDRLAALAPRVRAVADGERVAIGDHAVEAIMTPGHTPTCVCWYDPGTPALFAGDVLFVGSCGSVSDPAAYFASLQRLAALPESTRLYPGHDYGKTPTSSLAWELLHNPALTAASVEAFCAYKRIRWPR